MERGQLVGKECSLSEEKDVEEILETNGEWYRNGIRVMGSKSAAAQVV